MIDDFFEIVNTGDNIDFEGQIIVAIGGIMFDLRV